MTDTFAGLFFCLWLLALVYWLWRDKDVITPVMICTCGHRRLTHDEYPTRSGEYTVCCVCECTCQHYHPSSEIDLREPMEGDEDE